MTTTNRIFVGGLAIAGALALTAAHARPAEASCQTSFSRSASVSQSFGDYGTLWANYAGSASITGQDLSSGDRIEARGQVTSDVRIFGHRNQVARVEANAYSYYGDSVGGAIDVYAMGYNIYHRAWDAPLSITRSYSRTFFSASQWFFPGGIPVNTTETATGVLGITVAGGPTTTGIGADITPWVDVYATGSAAVDVVVAGVGVTGQMTLLRIDVPVHAELFLSGNHLDYALRVDAILDSMSGYAYVWVKVWVPFHYVTYKKTIASWSGYHSEWTVYNVNSATDLCVPSGGGGGGPYPL